MLNKSNSKINVLIPLFLVIFIDALGMTLILPIFAPLFSLPASQGGIMAGQISVAMRGMLYGFTMAIYPVFMFFAAPLLGDLSDRVGRKKVLLICLFGAALAAFLSGIGVVIHCFILFFLARIVAGATAGSMAIAQAAITDVSDEHTKTINLSLIGLAYTLGIVFGPILGGILASKEVVSWFSFSTPLFTTTILAILNAVALMFAFKETAKKVAKEITEKTIRIIKPLLMFIESFRMPELRNISLTTFFYSLGWGVYTQFIVLYLFQELHFSQMQLGYFTSWLGILMSLAMLFIIRIMVRFFAPRRIVSLAIGASIVGILLSMIPGSDIWQWVGVIPIACGFGVAFSAILTLFSNAVSNDLQGWVMGISTAIMAASGAVAGLLVAGLASYYMIAFGAMVVLWLISLGFSLLVERA